MFLVSFRTRQKEDRVGGEVWDGAWSWEMPGPSRHQTSTLLFGMLCLLNVSLFHTGAGEHIPKYFLYWTSPELEKDVRERTTET